MTYHMRMTFFKIIFRQFLFILICAGSFYTPSIMANCTYCYQIASVEITFRDRRVQHGYVSWSPYQEVNLNEKVFLEDAEKKQRIRFFKNLSVRSSGSEDNATNVYYALARNVILLRRYDIKKLKILDSNFGSTRSDIRIVKR